MQGAGPRVVAPWQRIVGSYLPPGLLVVAFIGLVVFAIVSHDDRSIALTTTVGGVLVVSIQQGKMNERQKAIHSAVSRVDRLDAETIVQIVRAEIDATLTEVVPLYVKRCLLEILEERLRYDQ